jgi:hypothetical protein
VDSGVALAKAELMIREDMECFDYGKKSVVEELLKDFG